MAFLVDDAEAAARQWAEVYGVGPFFVFEVDIPDATYRGEASPMRSIMGLAQSGGQQVELIQPLTATPSVYREFHDAGGSGVHHVCFWAAVTAARDDLVEHGCEVVQEGTTRNGDRFCYLTSPLGPPYVELVEPWAAGGGMGQFFALIASAAEGWDGTDPVRRR